MFRFFLAAGLVDEEEESCLVSNLLVVLWDVVENCCFTRVPLVAHTYIRIDTLSPRLLIENRMAVPHCGADVFPGKADHLR